MSSVGTLIRDARQGADLSIRSLAKRAGVAPSTVSRIEAGEIDPTAGMMISLMRAAGRQLEFNHSRSDGPEISGLVDAWSDETKGHRPDWTRLRAFLDYLALHPQQKGPATLRMPAPSGSEFLDNLLAGMAEKICDDAGLPRPRWTRQVPALNESWTTPGTPQMRAAALNATPDQLARRGIILAEQSLWRDPASVGV